MDLFRYRTQRVWRPSALFRTFDRPEQVNIRPRQKDKSELPPSELLFHDRMLHQKDETKGPSAETLLLGGTFRRTQLECFSQSVASQKKAPGISSLSHLLAWSKFILRAEHHKVLHVTQRQLKTLSRSVIFLLLEVTWRNLTCYKTTTKS